jgi:hypothetical protein
MTTHPPLCIRSPEKISRRLRNSVAKMVTFNSPFSYPWAELFQKRIRRKNPGRQIWAYTYGFS